jgi:AcrR family transcriptional regulator
VSDGGLALGADAADAGVADKSREAEVLAIALDLFHERGYAATSIADLAKALGIQKGSVYYYIQSKEHLLFRTLMSVALEIERIRVDVTTVPDLTAVQRLRLYVIGQSEFVANNVKRMAVYYGEMRHLSAELAAELRAGRRLQISYVEGLIEEAQRAGLISSYSDPKLLTKIVLSTVTSIPDWYHGEAMTPQAVAHHLWHLLAGGLRATE